MRRFCSQSYRMLNFTSKYSLIKIKDINDIKAGFHPNIGRWQEIKMYTAIFKHITVKGGLQLKDDIKKYFELRQNDDLTSQQQAKIQDFQANVAKFGPLIVIQILPFSGPLFLLYMYVYPQKLPAWFLIDSFYNEVIKERKKAQEQAIKYFEQKGIDISSIDLTKMTLEQLRRLSNLIFGYYGDGTKGINKLRKQPIPHLFSQSFSKYLLIRKMKKKLHKQTNIDLLQTLSFQQRIKWKYEEVMKNKGTDFGPLIDEMQQASQQAKTMKIEPQNVTNQKQYVKKKQYESQNKEKSIFNKPFVNEMQQAMKQQKKMPFESSSVGKEFLNKKH